MKRGATDPGMARSTPRPDPAWGLGSAAEVARANKAQRELKRAQLIAAVMTLRLEGHEFCAIADALALSTRSQACKLWHKGLREIPRVGSEQARRELLAKINLLEKGLWPLTKKVSTRLSAGYQIIELMKLRAKLEGAEAPRRSEVSGPKGGPIETTLESFVIVLPPEDPLPGVEPGLAIVG